MIDSERNSKTSLSEKYSVDEEQIQLAVDSILPHPSKTQPSTNRVAQIGQQEFEWEHCAERCCQHCRPNKSRQIQPPLNYNYYNPFFVVHPSIPEWETKLAVMSILPTQGTYFLIDPASQC
ncbi:hypothetical protein AAG570_006303 [Ranatra chinensis]|uniref:Uncharacterized protein n=1 Tax=Ranatra chinensis TaxID=642074 RepID=A0ABD0Z473_9HEMI